MRQKIFYGKDNEAMLEEVIMSDGQTYSFL